MFTGMYSGAGMWNTLTTRKVYSGLMYNGGGNRGGNSNKSSSGNSNYGGAGNSYDDSTPF